MSLIMKWKASDLLNRYEHILQSNEFRNLSKLEKAIKLRQDFKLSFRKCALITEVNEKAVRDGVKAVEQGRIPGLIGRPRKKGSNLERSSSSAGNFAPTPPGKETSLPFRYVLKIFPLEEIVESQLRSISTPQILHKQFCPRSQDSLSSRERSEGNSPIFESPFGSAGSF